MELGQRIKEARLEKGLSQRELCGAVITRNMLSLIENGSARPSMDTLRYLAGQLEKPISYFLDEAVPSPNQALILAARQVSGEQALLALQDYQAPDPVFDPEYYLISALAFMEMAQQALEEDRRLLAAQFLEQAARAGKLSPYYSAELEQRRLVLCHRAKALPLDELVVQLPDEDPVLMLRAQAALEANRYDRCAAFLEAVEKRDALWHYLRGEVYLAQKEYAPAAEHFLQAEQGGAQPVYTRLEECYRELGDFEKAYYYIRKRL